MINKFARRCGKKAKKVDIVPSNSDINIIDTEMECNDQRSNTIEMQPKKVKGASNKRVSLLPMIRRKSKA